MPLFNGDVVFLDTSGQVRALDGDLTLRADSTNTRSIIVGSGVSLRPDRDVRMDLGRSNFRWHRVYTGGLTTVSGTINNIITDEINCGGAITTAGAISGDTISSTNDITVGNDLFVTRNLDVGGSAVISGDLTINGNTTLAGVATGTIYPTANVTYTVGLPSLRYSHIYAASGVFNALSPQTSGSFLNVHGSLLPGTTLSYFLGNNDKRWGEVFSNSGSFLSLFSDEFNATTITVNDTLSIANTGGLNVFCGMGVEGLAVFNGGTFFGNAGAPSTDNTTSFGLAPLRWRDIYAVSGFIENLTPRTSGSFVLLNGSMFPDRTTTRTLGNTSRIWSHVYSSSGVFSFLDSTTPGGTILVDAATIAPNVAFSKLGTAFQYWQNIYGTTADLVTINTNGINIDGDITFNNAGHTIQMENGTFDLAASSFTFTNGSVNFATGSSITNRPTITFPNGVVGNISTDQDAAEVVHTVITIGVSGAAGGTIINTTNEVDIYNYTIPANTLGPSGTLRLIMNGNITNMTAGNVNYTPRVYVGGTVVWGDLLAVAAGPRAGCFELIADIQGLGTRQAQRVCGSVFLGTREAASVTGNGDWQSSNTATFAWGRWSSQAASGTVDFSQPVNLRVSMQLGTSSSNASYSGVKGTLVHYPYAIV